MTVKSAVGKACIAGTLSMAALLGAAGTSAAYTYIGGVRETGYSGQNSYEQAKDDAIRKIGAACDRLGGSKDAAVGRVWEVSRGTTGYLTYYVTLEAECLGA